MLASSAMPASNFLQNYTDLLTMDLKRGKRKLDVEFMVGNV